MALDFGRITINSELVLYLFGTPGQEPFWFMWDELGAGALGAVVLADTRRLDSCFPAVDFVEHRDIPFVLAVKCFDEAPRYPVAQVRDALDIDGPVPVPHCDVRSRESSKQVLATLLEHSWSAPGCPQSGELGSAAPHARRYGDGGGGGWGAMNRVAEVVCVGESMVLVAPDGGQRLASARSAVLTVAGAESTVALYLADLGHRTAWLSRVGADPFGERVLAEIGGGGVDVRLVERDPAAPTGVYFKDPGPAATTVHYYRAGSAASRLSPRDLDRLDLPATRLVHLSGVTPALSASAREMASVLFARAAAAGVLRSFDVNHRPALWPAAQAAPVLLDLARAADIVLVGLDEAGAVWGADSPQAVARLIGAGPAVVVKDAAVGATLLEAGERIFVPAEPVEVVEPVGAGDAFAAGYLSGVLRGAAPAARLRWGHRVAGFALRSLGDHADASSLRDALRADPGVPA